MGIEPKLMDPQRLADLREGLDWNRGVAGRDVPADLVDELLLDRDHWEAEANRERLEGNRNRAAAVDASEARMVEHAKAKRWRARCPVTAEDVEAAGATYAHLDAFAAVHGFTPARWNTPGLKRGRGASDIGWARDGVYIGDYAAWPGNRNRGRRGGWGAADVAAFVAMASTELDRPAFDILDEMAAMELG